MDIIQTEGKKIFLNKELLGVDKAQLWIGFAPEGPADNDDERVARERVEYEEERKRAEAAGEPIRPGGIEAFDVEESKERSGWYEVEISTWPAGKYRFNIHGLENQITPHGTQLRGVRDGEYSWAGFPEDLTTIPEDQKEYLYLEKNNAGFCMRIEVTEDHQIKPAGDGPGWIERWEEIRQEKVEPHYSEKEGLR